MSYIVTKYTYVCIITMLYIIMMFSECCSVLAVVVTWHQAIELLSQLSEVGRVESYWRRERKGKGSWMGSD